MHIRLDATHRLVYDSKAFAWSLQRCSPYAKFDQVKFDSLQKEDKRITIIKDKAGVQYSAKWSNLGSFTSERLDDAFMTWLHSLIDIKLGDKELDIKTMLSTFNDIKRAMSEALMLSTLFRIKVEMVPVQAQDFERLVAEEKRARKSANADKKKIPPGGLPGPETVFATQVLDADARSTLNFYKMNVTSSGGFDVDVEEQKTFTNKGNLSTFTSKGTEIVTVVKVGELVKLRGRTSNAPTGKSDEVIIIDNVATPPSASNKLEAAAEGKKKRGRPPGSKNKDPKKPESAPPVASTILAPKPAASALQVKPVSALAPKPLSGLQPKAGKK